MSSIYKYIRPLPGPRRGSGEAHLSYLLFQLFSPPITAMLRSFVAVIGCTVQFCSSSCSAGVGVVVAAGGLREEDLQQPDVHMSHHAPDVATAPPVIQNFPAADRGADQPAQFSLKVEQPAGVGSSISTHKASCVSRCSVSQ